MRSKRPRILIADEHNLVAELLTQMIKIEFEVVGSVVDGRSLVRVALETRSDFILADIALPILNGLEAGEQIKKTLPAAKLIFLSVTSDIDLVAEAFRRGASGYLLKTCAASEVLVALREVNAGKSYICGSLCKDKDEVSYLRRLDKTLLSKHERSTLRQREVLQLLAEGRTMIEIGRILNVTKRTVAFHKYRMMNSLHATNKTPQLRNAEKSRPLCRLGRRQGRYRLRVNPYCLAPCT